MTLDEIGELNQLISLVKQNKIVVDVRNNDRLPWFEEHFVLHEIADLPVLLAEYGRKELAKLTYVRL